MAARLAPGASLGTGAARRLLLFPCSNPQEDRAKGQNNDDATGAHRERQAPGIWAAAVEEGNCAA